jgi:hypothetical protein
MKKVVKAFNESLLLFNESQRLEENNCLKTRSLNYQNSGQHLQDAVLFDPLLQDLTCHHLSTQRLKSRVADNQAACDAASAAGGDRTFVGRLARHRCFCHAIHCCGQPNGGNCPDCRSRARNGNVPAMVGPGQCGFDCRTCGYMCKVVFEEHHRHTITIAITRAKEREGKGEDAPSKEKVMANLLQCIGDLLENHYVREHQHRDNRDNNEVSQDTASRMAHKLYSNSCFASANGKFRMSLQEDIFQTMTVQFWGRQDNGRRDSCGHDDGRWDGVSDRGGGCDGGGGRYGDGGQDGRLDGGGK